MRKRNLAGQADLFAGSEGPETVYDLAVGMARMREGTDRVAINSGDFMDDAVTFVCRLPDFHGPAEDLRRMLEEAGIAPHDPHAWGSLTRFLKAREILVKTGERVRMKSERSNGRETDVYVLGAGAKSYLG